MNQTKWLVSVVVLMAVVMGGMFLYKSKDKLLLGESFNNWNWSDAWSGGSGAEPPAAEKPKQDPVAPPQNETKPVGLTASSYREAINLSSKHGVPAVVYFGSAGCGHCVNMKKTTFSDGKVKDNLKRYVFVEVDAQSDREGVRKFGVTGLPSYVITNGSEDKLKMGSGYLPPDKFNQWLDNPNLMNQQKIDRPKEEPKKEEPKKEEPKPKRRDRKNP